MKCLFSQNRRWHEVTEFEDIWRLQANYCVPGTVSFCRCLFWIDPLKERLRDNYVTFMTTPGAYNDCFSDIGTAGRGSTCSRFLSAHRFYGVLLDTWSHWWIAEIIWDWIWYDLVYLVNVSKLFGDVSECIPILISSHENIPGPNPHVPWTPPNDSIGWRANPQEATSVQRIACSLPTSSRESQTQTSPGNLGGRCNDRLQKLSFPPVKSSEMLEI